MLNSIKVILACTILTITQLTSNLYSQYKIQNVNQKFIIIGDTQHIGFWESLYWDYWHENNEKKTRLLIKEIAKRNPDFVLHLGDMVKDGSDSDSWNEYDYDYTPIIRKRIPYLPVLGNHEYIGRTTILYKNIKRRFPFILNNTWYSFAYDQLGFIMLNSNFDELSTSENTAQRKWYENQLKEFEKDTSIKKIIVVTHHPPFTNSKIVSPNVTVEKYYVLPFLKNRKCILFFSGHCHSYERFIKGEKTFIVSGGGGGPRQKLDVDIKTRKYNDMYDGPSQRFFHFIEVEKTNSELKLNVIRMIDNNSFDIAESIIFPL